jgi:hypothetical protein
MAEWRMSDVMGEAGSLNNIWVEAPVTCNQLMDGRVVGTLSLKLLGYASPNLCDFEAVSEPVMK